MAVNVSDAWKEVKCQCLSSVLFFVDKPLKPRYVFGGKWLATKSNIKLFHWVFKS